MKNPNETIPGGAYIHGDLVINASGAKIGEVDEKGKVKIFGEAEPLSFEETMSRFQSGDTAPEVFESLKFHQAELVRRNAEKSGKSKTETKELPTEAELNRMNKTDLTAQAKAEGFEITDDLDTNAKIAQGIFAARK